MKVEEATSDVIMVMRTTLSKKEFAAALGMKENDLFVQKMFNIVDKDGDNRISFQVCLINNSTMVAQDCVHVTSC